MINDLLNEQRKTFTHIEKQVYRLKLQGYTYEEIASVIDGNRKTVDNAIQRIHKRQQRLLLKEVE